MLLKITSDNVILQNTSAIFEISDTPAATLYLIGKCYDIDYHRISADEFLKKIYQNPRSALSCHSGIYSAIYHDKKNHHILFFTDALGLGRLYYYKDDHTLLISDHTDEIVQAANITFSIDYSAWSQFLAFAYILGNRTYFNEIKACRPGILNSLHINTWYFEETHSEIFTDIIEDSTMSFDDAVKTSVQQLKSVIDKILANNRTKRIICPLSGGYDSRCIAACLKNLGCNNVETYSSYFDDGNGADQEYAEKVAEYLHFPNIQFTPDDGFFEREISSYLSDVNFESSMYTVFWDFLKKINFSDSVTFDGYAGDHLLRIARHASINYMDDGSLPPDFLDSFFSKNLIKFPKLCMDKRHYSYLTYLARQGMAEELSQWNYNITLYYLFNRNAHNIAYSIWHMDQLTDVFTPFADYGFIKFALSIPYTIKNDDNFYKAVINGLVDGVGNLPSTNDPSAQNISKPIIFNNNKYQSLMLEELNDYWEAIGGMYYLDFLKETIQKTEEMKWRLSHSALPFWIYKKWKCHYADNLATSSLEAYFKEFSKITNHEQTTIMVMSNDDRRKAINYWLEFLKHGTKLSTSQKILNKLSHKRAYKTNILFTMDVEGFNEGPLFAHGIDDFTNSHKAVEQLIFGGKMANGHTVLETLAADKDIPLTFFTEIYTPILTPEELHELLSVCNSTGNEAALHCHAFGLPHDFLNERNLKPDGYKSEQGFSKILQYGVNTFKEITHTTPLAFRSGNFQVYPGHFEALKKNGFKIDSSLFYESPHNHTEFSKNQANECQIINGIVEVPCTSFFDLATNKASKLDMNLIPFEKKLECIARNIAAGSKVITLLMHSWSFSNYYVHCGQYGKLSKYCHHQVSEQALDELRYLAEFVRMTEKADLINISNLYESGNSVLNDEPAGLVDVCGESVPLPVYKMPPSFGKLRALPKEGFIDLKQGKLLSNDMTQTLFTSTASELSIMLPAKKQPHAEDFTEISYSIPVKPSRRYKVSMVLDCPYFKENFRGRNTIRYSVQVDNAEIFSNYITNPERDEYIEYITKTTTNTLNISIRLTCLKDEMPWGWGTCSKTKIKGIHVFPT